MRFTVEPEQALFAGSVRAALEGWEAPREPVLGSWWDDRDDALALRLAEAGWEELWGDAGLLAPAVAGALELGRAVAPLSLVDEATLGAPLVLGVRARHAHGRSPVALPGPGLTLRLVPAEGGEREPTLDGTGTVRGLVVGDGDPVEGGRQRLRAWGAVTLGYLAGLADAATALGLGHVTSREQFGAPLGALPVVRGRLADAGLLRDGLALAAWRSADPDGGWPGDALAWAGGACRNVTAQALQLHGGTGFALEGGVHRWFRRAKVCHVWVEAVLAAVDRDG